MRNVVSAAGEEWEAGCPANAPPKCFEDKEVRYDHR